jgi:hypothetical protein
MMFKHLFMIITVLFNQVFEIADEIKFINTEE